MTSPRGGEEPPLWESEGRRLLADAKVFRVHAEHFKRTDGEGEGEFSIIEAFDWSVAVALTPVRKLVMVRQFRFGVQAVGWEMPAGIVDAGESFVQAAVRELREEAGYIPVASRLLGVIHPNPALQTNRCGVVLCEGCQPSGQTAWDEHESMVIHEFTIPEIISLIREGGLTHAICVAAFGLWQLDANSSTC